MGLINRRMKFPKYYKPQEGKYGSTLLERLKTQNQNNVSKSLAKIRIETIDNLIKENKSNEELIRLLSNGFIPNELKEKYDADMLKGVDSVGGELVEPTDLEMSQYSNFFYLNDKKILGEEKSGSGFINPVITKGNIGELEKISYKIPEMLIDKPIQEVKEEKLKDILEKPLDEEPLIQEPTIEKSVQDLILVQKINQFKDKSGQKESKSDIISVGESLELYNSNISEAEIKAWVYYKRLFGNPMNGYEKYFLKAANTKSTLVFTTQSVYLKDQQFRDVKFVPSGTSIGIKTRFKNEYDNETYIIVKNELNELYYVPQSKIKEEEMFNAVGADELKQLVLDKGICFKNGEYVPIPFYTYGNIYEIKDDLVGKFNAEKNQYEGGYYDELVAMFGEYIAIWHKQLIEDAIKLKGEYSFSNPEKAKRPFLSKENPLATEFKVKELNESSGISFEEIYKENRTRRDRWKSYDENTEYTLFEAFAHWFRASVNDSALVNTTKSDILRFYINNQNFPSGEGADLTEKEKDAIKLNAKIEGESWFQEFINSALTYQDMLRLNYLFNRKYNSFTKINLSKIPVAFQANRKVFSRESFRLKPVQRDGLAFISATNSGCFAYDVGFGKTLCAIHVLAQVLKEGKVMRPLIAVPKPVYNNWIREMFGFWTDGKEKRMEQFEGSTFVNGALTGTKYKLNLWYNISDKLDIKNAKVEPYSITIVTYQGLEKIGYSRQLREEFANELTSVIGKQSVSASSDERKKAQQTQDIYSKLGIAESDTKVDIDTCGFDYLIIDEAHNFKNVFGSVALEKEQNDIWKIQKKPSTKRAIKAFVLSLYLQRKYNGNVLLLTATPFTNSPLEIFSMMSLVGYQNLKKYGIGNIHTFLSMFIETISEFTVDAMNNIKVDTVIKSFKNKNLLRDILYRHFDYQDNPKIAGIKRPCKVNFPNKKINTYLEMSETQMVAQQMVRIEAASYDRKTNAGAMGRALNWAKSNSLSPFLVSGVPTYESLKELVNESPKLKFAIDCIKSVKEYHESKGQEMSGQVIYSNRGIGIFEDFKAALEENCGFKKKISFGDELVDEVEIIKSSSSEKDMDRKEIIKDAFNKGFVKVIIGTATIKEGVNLQERGTCLYNLDLDWNPTDFKQLEGRIHRQGNMFRYTRIVVPLVQNTLDSFINQKLDEKGKRIATIWDKTNEYNSLEEDNFVDPMEIKFALISDEAELIKMKSEQDMKSFRKQLEIAEDKYQSIFTIEQSIEKFYSYKKDSEENIIETKNNHEQYLVLINKFKHKRKENLTKNDLTNIEDVERKVNENIVLLDAYLNHGEIVSLFDVYRNLKKRTYTFKVTDGTFDYGDLANENISYGSSQYQYGADIDKLDTSILPKMIIEYGQIKKFERMTLSSYGLTMNDDISNIKEMFLKEVNHLKASIEYLSTDQYNEKVSSEIRAELRKREEQRGTIEDRVAQFASYNYLLSYPFEDELSDNCELPETENSSEFNLLDDEIGDEYEEVLVDETPLKSNGIKEENKLKYKKTKESEEEKATKLISDAKFFIPAMQIYIIKTNMEFEDVRVRINELLPKIPTTYQTENIPLNSKVAYLHYFYGDMDWYIFEKDKGSSDDKVKGIQQQAFGMADFGYGAELGYISIDELIKGDKVELDLYFEPKKWGEIIGEPIEETEIKPEPKFKVGDYVSYMAGDIDKEKWYGIVREVVDLDNEFAYNIDAVNIDYRQMHLSKNNQLYEAQLTEISEDLYNKKLKEWESKNSVPSEKTESVEESKEKLVEYAGKNTFKKFLNGFIGGSWGAYAINFENAMNVVGIDKNDSKEEAEKKIKTFYLNAKKEFNVLDTERKSEARKLRGEYHLEQITKLAENAYDKMEQQIAEAESTDKTEIAEAIEMLNELLPTLKGKDKKEAIEAIEMLKELQNNI
jgi:hypothetical protein